MLTIFTRHFFKKTTTRVKSSLSWLTFFVYKKEQTYGQTQKAFIKIFRYIMQALLVKNKFHVEF